MAVMSLLEHEWNESASSAAAVWSRNPEILVAGYFNTRLPDENALFGIIQGHFYHKYESVKGLL